MKLKYFLRGLGAGIIFGALIMLAAYMTSDAYKISDEEVIERAEALGMTMEDNSILTPSDEEDSEEEIASEDKVEPEVKEDIDTKDTTEDAESDTTEATTEATTEEATTEEVTTEEVTEEVIATDNKTITVRPGMSSYEVSIILRDAGIISDADDFDAYLNANGYSTKIEVGDFSCSSDMSYEELAKILTNTVE